MNSSPPCARSRRPLFGVETTGFPPIVISARTCPSPGVSISSARQAAGSSPKISAEPADAAGPAAELGAAAAARRSRRRSHARPRRAGTSRRPRDRDCRSAGSARRRASSRASRTPACRCRSGRTRRRGARPPARARFGGSNRPPIPRDRRRALRSERGRQRAHGLDPVGHLGEPLSGIARAPPRTARVSGPAADARRCPGRMKWCSSASSRGAAAARIDHDQLAAAGPERAQPAADVGRGHQAAVGGERVGAEHQQVVGPVYVGDRALWCRCRTSAPRPSAWGTGRPCWPNTRCATRAP